LVSPLFVSGERRDSPTASVPDEIKIIETADENGQYDTPVLTGGSEFFLWVIVKYSGPFSKGHETSACWRWDDDSRRLVLHEKHNSRPLSANVGAFVYPGVPEDALQGKRKGIS
jgi:hypothetical protein